MGLEDATTIRVRAGEVVIADGPFAERRYLTRRLEEVSPGP